MTKIAIIGSGIAGFSVATLLAQRDDVDIVVFEKGDTLGGRANVWNDGEHCPRLYLADYTHFFAILAHVVLPSGVAIADTMQQVRRMCWTERNGWVEISRLYSCFAPEISFRDKLAMLLRRRVAPLIAEEHRAENEAVTGDQNIYGSRKNYSLSTIFRVLVSLHQSRLAYSLPGRTDVGLILPWAEHLRRKGVDIRTGTEVRRICRTPERDGLMVEHSASPSVTEAEHFDYIVVTSFVTDTIALLDRSELAHSVPSLIHTHCKSVTCGLDPRENVLASDVPVVYARDGINILVQPEISRCVALCTKSMRTDDAFVAAAIERDLGLQYGISWMRSRENKDQGEAVFAADFFDMTKLVDEVDGLFFAGSYVKNSYPVDSAEAAARSATETFSKLAAQLDSPTRSGSHPRA